MLRTFPPLDRHHLHGLPSPYRVGCLHQAERQRSLGTFLRNQAAAFGLYFEQLSMDTPVCLVMLGYARTTDPASTDRDGICWVSVLL